jgi:hypothetical protein
MNKAENILTTKENETTNFERGRLLAYLPMLGCISFSVSEDMKYRIFKTSRHIGSQISYPMQKIDGIKSSYGNKIYLSISTSGRNSFYLQNVILCLDN